MEPQFEDDIPDDFEDDAPGAEEVQSIKEVVGSFLVAMKNYGIYPEDHALSKKFLENIELSLKKYLNRYGSLRLDVEKDSLLCRGAVVHEVSREEEDFGYLIFRDGVLWLEFHRGIEQAELITFYRILNRYKVRDDDDEGDLVTALWDENLPHISFDVADSLWGEEDFEIPSLTMTDAKGLSIRRDRDDETEREEGSSESKAVKLAVASLLELSPEEKMVLRGMVIEEESWDNTEDVLDVLLIILKDQDAEEDFSTILGVLEEEILDTLAQGEFRLPFVLLKELRDMCDFSKDDKTWRIPLLKRFFDSVSSPESLGVIEPVIPKLKAQDADQMAIFREMFSLLGPNAVVALAPMMFKVSSSQIQQEILEIIRSLASRDLTPIEQLLTHPNEVLLKRLASILGSLEGDRPCGLLLQMTRHASEAVRAEALAQADKRDARVVKQLFHLIEDPSPLVRRQVLDILVRERSILAENLLRDYIEKQEYELNDDQHLLECYRALGKCGSAASIPFLKKTYLSRPWSDLLGARRALHRQGAALALAYLDNEEANQVLEQGSRSLFRNMKRASQKARDEIR